MRNEILALTVLLHVASLSKGCLQTNKGNLPTFRDPGNDAVRIESNPIQVIVKSYEFQCCGTVTEWGAIVEQGGRNHDEVYSIKFQIWRPTEGNSYLKIGQNSFSLVTLDPDSVISETPTTNQQLEFQEGDVLGYYLEQEGDNNGGIQFDESFTQEELWYTTGNQALQNEDRLDIGTEGDLSLSTTLGPLISVSVATSTCTVQPSLTPFPQTLPTGSSTGTNPDGVTATAASADSDSNIPLIAGFTAALAALTVGFTAAVLAVIVLLRRRRVKKNTSEKTSVELNSLRPNVEKRNIPHTTSILGENVPVYEDASSVRPKDTANTTLDTYYDYVEQQRGLLNIAYSPPQSRASEAHTMREDKLWTIKNKSYM